jgi:hypothetical protein
MRKRTAILSEPIAERSAARVAHGPPAAMRYARADVVPQSIAIKAVLSGSVTARRR